MVAVGDVVVDSRQQLIVVLVGREAVVGAGVVAILLLHKVGHALHVGLGSARDEVVGIGYAVDRCAPAVGHGWRLYHLAVDEEEEFVLDDGAAECEAVGGGAILVACGGYLLVVHGAASHILVAVVDVGRALERICTALSDRIHAAADEVGLAHIVGRDHHLQLFDSVDADGVAAAGQVLGETEVVVEVGTVDREVAHTAIASGETHAFATVGREACDVGD